MHPDEEDDWFEDWELYPDDWYDGGDEILLESHRLYLEKCFELPAEEH